MPPHLPLVWSACFTPTQLSPGQLSCHSLTPFWMIDCCPPSSPTSGQPAKKAGLPPPACSSLSPLLSWAWSLPHSPYHILPKSLTTRGINLFPPPCVWHDQSQYANRAEVEGPSGNSLHASDQQIFSLHPILRGLKNWTLVSNNNLSSTVTQIPSSSVR